MATLLRWWLIVCATVTGLGLLQFSGLLYPYLLQIDHSRLTLVDLGLFALVTAIIGYVTAGLRKLRHGQEPLPEEDRYLAMLKPLNFASDLMMAIGMMGTLVGFMMMFSGNIGHLDASNAESVKAVVVSMSHGFSTGIVTTLVGIVTSAITKLQLINVKYGLSR